jgi:hypothetical protein
MQQKVNYVCNTSKGEPDGKPSMNDVWEILYKIFIFRADLTTNVATIAVLVCDWPI